MNATVLLTSVDINIPGYKILRPIGEGGMASVFLAVQESLDREVALKVMSPILAANAEFASRFVVEGKTHRLMVSGGFVEVDNDHVILMCENAALADEVSVEAEKKSLQGFEKQLASLGAAATDDASYLTLKAEVDRSTARLTLIK